MSAYDDAALPAICKPWCDKGDGHTDQHPDERDCWSEFHDLPIRHSTPDYSETSGWRYDVLSVHMRQKEGMATPLIRFHLASLDAVILRLTVPEAELLHTSLGDLLALVADEPVRIVEEARS